MLTGLSVTVTSADVQSVAERLAEFRSGLPPAQQAVVARLEGEAKELASEFEVQGFAMETPVNVLGELGIA